MSVSHFGFPGGEQSGEVQVQAIPGLYFFLTQRLSFVGGFENPLSFFEQNLF
jgi:hypothetical protein